MGKESEDKIKTRRRRQYGSVAVSLEDVANQANVSTATVSRVLNNPEIVSKSSRAAVDAAITALGYIPDGAARALASRYSNTIGAIFPTLDNAIFSAGIQSLQNRLKTYGYKLFIASHEYDLKEELSEVRSFLRQGVDGVLLIGADHDSELPELLNQKGTPYVHCWTFNSESSAPSIGFDNKKAARKLTKYLLDLGHMHIGVIAGRIQNNDRANDRLQGVREEMEAHGLSLAEDYIVERSYSVKQGREATRLLLNHKSPPTAIVCGNDILALGAVAECQSAGLVVPDDMSITGFDDLDISSQLIPALTTIRVPAAEMGERAADFLISQIKNKSMLQHIEIGTDLMVRDTTAKPRLEKLVFR